MPRIKVNLPENFLFSTEIHLRITDLNYGAHLGNDSLLGILHEARVQFLQHIGSMEVDRATGRGHIMADVAIEYKSEAFYGDVLHIDMAANDLSKYGFDLVYRVRNQEGRDIARAKTGMLTFDYNTRKLLPLAEEYARRLRGE
ncbi:thioesterase family protein [Hymenobacter sp. BT186]|uniref:Thioesterase family protein n=1 Tax=Hymenobacter telluris TaxID=2816474 RepID=A0A939JB43_9BACT|nr:thioesterase family protein [Hymenobacter telluris]MBO0360534.1 thioesterase family protein [Hymenobacter telluris]MBW3376561.1 thioesterase family protein [Hymenobacter norwichensis]